MFLVLSLTAEVKEGELWYACSEMELDCEDLDFIFKITTPFRYMAYKN